MSFLILFLMKVLYKITLFQHLFNCFYPCMCPVPFSLVTISFTIKDLFAVFVQLQSSDHHLAGVNAHMNSFNISFLLLHSFSVADIFLPVNLDHIASLLLCVVDLHNLDFIILLDRHGQNFVFLSQLLGDRRHHLPATGGRYIEMPFMALSVVRSHKGTELCFNFWHFCDGHERGNGCLYIILTSEFDH